MRTSVTGQSFFNALETRTPIFRPNTSPLYSNTGIILLAYALESLTGRPYKDILEAALIDRLKLSGTSFSKPAEDKRSVIPYNVSTSLWDLDVGEMTPTGGLYNSLNISLRSADRF